MIVFRLNGSTYTTPFYTFVTMRYTKHIACKSQASDVIRAARTSHAFLNAHPRKTISIFLFLASFHPPSLCKHPTLGIPPLRSSTIYTWKRHRLKLQQSLVSYFPAIPRRLQSIILSFRKWRTSTGKGRNVGGSYLTVELNFALKRERFRGMFSKQGNRFSDTQT